VPKLAVTRLTVTAVGVLLCSLPLTGTSLVREVGGGAAPEVSADLHLVKGGCSGFGPRDVLRGRAGRNGPTCRPIGLDGGIVRPPIAKAKKRDRRNYGRRVHGKRGHTGTDFRAPCGTSVKASHTGKVVLRPRGKRGTRTVGVSTGPRRLTTWYGHLKKVKVRSGAVVHAGRHLGKVGKVRRSSRCHLHFVVHQRAGLRDPARVNPSRWLRNNRGRHVSGMSPGDRRKGIFVAATLNVLGHTHTARRGKKRRQFAGSERRMDLAISLLRSNHVSLVGLQELQGKQRKMFLRKTKGWRVHSPPDPQDSIAWRASRFRLVRAGSVPVPYFRNRRPMPIVVLRDRGTGKKLVVISVHNPRGKTRRMKQRRAEALRRELRKVHEMRRKTGAPVILMGDFNDKSRRLYCKVTRHGLKASSRGVRGRQCRPSQVAGIDWIFGTRKIRFLGHQRVQGGIVKRTTDHPFVLAKVRR
jgi:hypothetical protein